MTTAELNSTLQDALRMLKRGNPHAASELLWSAWESATGDEADQLFAIAEKVDAGFPVLAREEIEKVLTENTELTDRRGAGSVK